MSPGEETERNMAESEAWWRAEDWLAEFCLTLFSLVNLYGHYNLFNTMNQHLLAEFWVYNIILDVLTELWIPLRMLTLVSWILILRFE